MKTKIVVYLYNRLFDPVVQSNIWLFIQDCLKDPQSPYQFHLVSYEDARFPYSQEEKERLCTWQTQGLTWTPLAWHQGTELSKKFIDLASGLRTVARLRLIDGYKHIIAFASISGAFAYVFSRLLGLKLMLTSFEPHSEYGVDNGLWAEQSLQFKILSTLERYASRDARVIVSGTRFMEARLEGKMTGRFFKIPTAVDDLKFQFDTEQRAQVREALKLENRWVLLYTGKFGGLYYTDEFARMFNWLSSFDKRLFLLIVTLEDRSKVEALLLRNGVAADKFLILSSDYRDIQKYCFAADLGIISVPPGPSKRYVSNIKVGEYLCSGLPYLITSGVSEDYIHALERDVGVVVESFEELPVKAAWPRLRGFLEADPQTIRQRCRDFGVEYRGFSRLNPRFREALREFVRPDWGPNCRYHC